MSNDLISRSALKDLEEMEYIYFRSPAAVPFYEAHKVWDVIDNAPAIDPESLRPKGRWELGVMVDADYYTNCLAWICSCCDYRFADKSKKPKSPKLNYCPNCGAKMGG